MVKINGEPCDAGGMTLAAYLKQSLYDCTRIAIECNGEFVPRAKYEETVLKDGDSVEIVCFVGGG